MKSSDFLFGKAYARVAALQEIRQLTLGEETQSLRSTLSQRMERFNADAVEMSAEEHSDVFLHFSAEIDRTDDVGAKASLCMYAAAEAGLAGSKTLDVRGKEEWDDRAQMMEWHALQLGGVRKH